MQNNYTQKDGLISYIVLAQREQKKHLLNLSNTCVHCSIKDYE